MEYKLLSVDQQYEINRIASACVKDNPELDFSTCYVILLFYYLMQYSGYKIDTIPDEYRDAVHDLYKAPTCSYIHYWNQIFETNNPYVKPLKRAEICEKGDDPRCPWL